MIICRFCQQETKQEVISTRFPSCHACKVSYEVDPDDNVLNMLFMPEGQYCLEIDLINNKTILWYDSQPNVVLMQRIMTINYMIPIKSMHDIEVIISRLLNLKAFS